MKRRGRPKTPGMLTARELEVLELLRRGLSNRDIAERLGISLAGAKFHVSEIIGKLEVGSREEAAAWRPKLPVLLSFAGLPRPRFGYVAATGGVWIAVAALVAFLVLINVRRDDNVAVSVVAPAATPTPNPNEQQQLDEFRRFSTLDEAAAVATFPVLMPSPIPAGFRIYQILYYKPGFRCPRDLDYDYCTRVHNDHLEVHYSNGNGRTFIIGQGYGSSASGGLGHIFAPAKYKGVVEIAGRQARWASGYPRSGMVDPGGGRPVQESDWVADPQFMLTWFASRDLNPTNTESPRCFSLFTQTMNLEELFAMAASIPLPPLVPGRVDC